MTVPFGGIDLDPVELGINGNAILGIKESGKSYLGTELAEIFFDQKIPFVSFDPIGIWHNMRYPGRGKGFPIVVAGGFHGDIRLKPETAPQIVEAAMKQGVSIVLDLFHPDLSKSDWRKIVCDCALLLLHRNSQYGLRHVFIEEAAEFVPQSPRDWRVYEAVERVIRMGGNSRLGCTLISPRSQEVNKAVLEACENMFLFRQRGKNALENLKKWLDIAGASAGDVMKTLPNMPRGECWAWLGGSDTPVHVKVPTKRSFHPDRRAQQGEVARPQGQPVSVDKFLEALNETLPKIQEEAQANDPRALKAEIAALKRQIAQTDKARPAAAPPSWPDQRELVAQLTDELATSSATLERLTAASTELQRRQQAALAALGGESVPIPAAPAPRPRPSPAPAPIPRAPTVRAQTPAIAPGDLGAVPAPILKVLNAIAWWNAFGLLEPSASQVGFIAGYAPTGGTFKKYRGEAKTRGLVIYPADGRLQLTDAGQAEVTPPDVLPTVEALHDAVRSNIDGPLVKLLDAILQAYPDAISVEEVGAASGYEASGGTFKKYRGQLKTLELISYPESGMLRAADWLFP